MFRPRGAVLGQFVAVAVHQLNFRFHKEWEVHVELNDYQLFKDCCALS